MTVPPVERMVPWFTIGTPAEKFGPFSVIVWPATFVIVVVFGLLMTVLVNVSARPVVLNEFANVTFAPLIDSAPSVNALWKLIVVADDESEPPPFNVAPLVWLNVPPLTATDAVGAIVIVPLFWNDGLVPVCVIVKPPVALIAINP